MTNIRKVAQTDKAKPLGGDFSKMDIAFITYSSDKWELRHNNILKAVSIGYRVKDHENGKKELLEYGESLGYRVFEC